MDIRNFFGKPKAKRPSASASAGGAKKKSGASAAASSKTSRSSKVKVAAAVAAAGPEDRDTIINVDDSSIIDTDIHMEDLTAVTLLESPSIANANAAKNSNNGNNKNRNEKRRKRIQCMDSDDDDDEDDSDYQDDDLKEPSKAVNKKSSSLNHNNMDMDINMDSNNNQPAKQQSPNMSKLMSVKRSSSSTTKAKSNSDNRNQNENQPPKFHPPSSQLLEHIDIHNSTARVAAPVHIQSTLPALPADNDSSFFTSLDTTMTPHCLTGLTFCFTGILSTNDDVTRLTNAQVSVASPSKADYYRNRRYDTAAVAVSSNGNDDDDLNLNIPGVTTNNFELSRDNATDIIKILGGRVTTSVSSKTDYLVAGNILEDGREVVEGSKYKKCLEIWDTFRLKQRQEEEENNMTIN